ncbi:MAG TPA: haloacid dehalogenase-like hydrolase [Gemmatimonadaceae bacterium]|jgi:phosphoglycolate phosphatase-like HAD superfamily hydrolase|nr:haloacid dehalogenase-like hydrolase [Gemmatimonadaceae bacterium]
MKLVLFDIDGTIMAGGGAGKRAVTRALVEVFGTSGPTDHRFDGKTDPQIVRELMRLEGHGDPHIDERMPRLLERYLEYLHDELQRPPHARLLPGIRELLDALEPRSDVVLGLLTGNLAAGARAKLAAVGLNPDRFRVGAYGSDHEVRGELPTVAQRRARDELGLDVPGRDVVVIGDTPNDLECGRRIGARAIGVATGHYTVDQLLAHAPAAVFPDLSDTAAVVNAIIAASAPASP